MRLNIKRLNPDSQIPQYGSAAAAGMDLFSAVDLVVPPQTRKLVSTGISVSWETQEGQWDENPEKYYLRIAPRSGLSVKSNIDIGAGVVDSDYRGEIFVCFINNSLDKPYAIQKGDRIAQMILTRFEQFKEVVLVEEHVETARGEGGFGSTGK
uniref:dUTP diphosphatase n=1 Tax=viral metagenome TaxID=1070528 RepID=A0A6C0JYW4_9ZZZZ